MAKRRQGRAFWAKLNLGVREQRRWREPLGVCGPERGQADDVPHVALPVAIQGAPRAKRAVRVLPVRVVGSDCSGRDLSIDCNGLALRFAADTDPSYVAALVVALRAC
jgi:hypothetical protein